MPGPIYLRRYFRVDVPKREIGCATRESAFKGCFYFDWRSVQDLRTPYMMGLASPTPNQSYRKRFRFK